jgi:hypothetical protein
MTAKRSSDMESEARRLLAFVKSDRVQYPIESVQRWIVALEIVLTGVMPVSSQMGFKCCTEGIYHLHNLAQAGTSVS